LAYGRILSSPAHSALNLFIADIRGGQSMAGLEKIAAERRSLGGAVALGYAGHRRRDAPDLMAQGGIRKTSSHLPGGARHCQHVAIYKSD
jgi:hypothetical protein